MVLGFNVTHQHITRNDAYIPVEGSANYLTAQFNFVTPEWKNITKTAIFTSSQGSYEVLLVNDACTIPWEVLEADSFDVSVFGGDLITVDVANVKQTASGYTEGQTPEPPTQSVYAQIIARLDAIGAGGSSGSSGSGGKYIAQITQTTSTESGSRNTITVKYSDNTTDTLYVYNGAQGETGAAGQNGTNGQNGQNGQNYVITADDYSAIADVVLGQLTVAEEQEV